MKPWKQKLSDDVACVREHAAVVITIRNDETIDVVRRADFRLNVIAVIGPTVIQFGYFREAVLLEVGIGRTRPYTEARGNGYKKGMKYIPSRRRFAQLTTDQYRQVARIIFSLLKDMATARISQWKEKNVNGQRSAFYHRHRTVFVDEVQRKAIGGVRYSVSGGDKLMLADIFAAELYHNRKFKEQIRGLARFIDMLLTRYKNWFGNDRFLKLKFVQEVVEQLAERMSKHHRYRLRPYHLPLLVKSGIKEIRIWDIFEHLGCKREVIEKAPEIALAEKGEGLAGCRTRLAEITLRVTTGLEKKRGYITFEVFKGNSW